MNLLPAVLILSSILGLFYLTIKIIEEDNKKSEK